MQMKRTLLAIAIGAISAGLAGGALAQATENDTANDEQQEQLLDNQEAQGGQEARSGDQDEAATGGQDTDTDTDEGDADLDDLDAESELPEEGDDAEDYEAIDDDLEGDQADEDAEQADDAAAQADDDAMQADDAVDQDDTAAQPGAVGQADEGGQAGAADGFAATGPADVGQGAQLHDSLSGLMVSEVQGMTVVNQNGDNLGRVENVVRHDDAGDLHVIITVGGFWIFGGSDVALPLADMQLEGEQLVLQDIIGEDELDGMASGYDEDRYSDVDGNLMLSEAAGR